MTTKERSPAFGWWASAKTETPLRKRPRTPLYDRIGSVAVGDYRASFAEIPCDECGGTLSLVTDGDGALMELEHTCDRTSIVERQNLQRRREKARANRIASARHRRLMREHWEAERNRLIALEADSPARSLEDEVRAATIAAEQRAAKEEMVRIRTAAVLEIPVIRNPEKLRWFTFGDGLIHCFEIPSAVPICGKRAVHGSASATAKQCPGCYVKHPEPLESIP